MITHGMTVILTRIFQVLFFPRKKLFPHPRLRLERVFVDRKHADERRVTSVSLVEEERTNEITEK